MVIIFFFAGCGSYNDKSTETPTFKDNLAIYSDYDHPQLIDWQVNVPVPNDYLCTPWFDINGEPRPCTLDDIIHDTDPYDSYKPEVHIALFSDKPIPYDGTGALSQKGKSTRHARQKSFRIKLDDNAPFYEGQKVLQLDKHPYDKSRVRNKLFFDLFVGIPHFVSLRTNFSHLYISQADENNTDFGLFTHVEKVDKYYLKNHKLQDGRIYKAQYFSFRYTNDLAVDNDGAPIDPEAFERIIEPEKGKNHKKLIEMIKAIDAAPEGEGFMKVFNKYFDYDNYITWLAVNYNTCNADTITQNFFLYNPKGSDKFFFIPWDYDGASREIWKIPSWQYGLGRYWGIPLHHKFLTIQSNREAVKRKIEEIHQNYINASTVSKRLQLYRPIVEPIISVLPDSHYLDYDKWLHDFEGLPARIDQNVELFNQQWGLPMPYWQSVEYNSTLIVKWGKAVDFENDPIVYDVFVSKNPNMDNPILEYHDLSGNDLEKEGGVYVLKTDRNLDAGNYFLKVIAKEANNPGRFQIAFDEYKDENNTKYYGVLEFKIP